jgi:hypothetical protein
MTRLEKIAELREANAKLTALLHEAYVGPRGPDNQMSARAC